MDHDRAIGNPPPGINLQLVNSNITAQNNVNVTVNDHPDSMLTRLSNSLKPVTSAYHDSYEAIQRSECFPNTRLQVLSDIEKWIKGESHQAPIYILYGVVGIGKSTVAQTVATRAAALGLLGASFFFSRDEDLRAVARHFFPTIAYRLSCHDNAFATQISHSLNRNPDASAKLLTQQLTHLLLEPLQNVLSQNSTPTLIVVDALDECDEKGAGELLTLLGHHVHRVKGLKILITSRPEAHLRHVLHQDGSHEKFCLHEIEESIVHSDIRLYLRFHLSAEEICKVARHRETTWQPTDRDMEMLCGICGTLFIIAATATKFILGSNFTPQKQLSRFIDGVSTSDFVGAKHNKALDHTYIRVLCAALSGDDEIDREWFGNLNRVLGALISLANPLPCSALALLLEMDREDIEANLSQLHSLVAPSGNGAQMTYRIHHKSFPDFIINRERIQQALANWKPSIRLRLDSLLWVDVADHHLQLAKACFRTMDRGLKRNMANLNEKDWYKDKEDIPHIRPDLIPRELAYAAMHWALHLRSGLGLNEDLELQMYLDGWASRHILSWMEVMVILDRVNDIYGILQDAIKSFPEKLRCASDSSRTEQNLKIMTELLSDACRFVQQGGEVMKISPMHIYRSCLTFVPTTTSLYKLYGNMTTLTGGVGKSYQWNPLFATLIGHSCGVRSVAFSTDGSRVASGSHDETIRLWDANTGTHLSTLTGHTSSVYSVAFSADGSRVVSGSSDKTVKLWDANTGAHLSTLTGHSSSVRSVAFSADGSQVASGSFDETVQLWNANTGAHLSTLTGHLSSIYTVAFSADGSRVASGSDDETIRLWDASSGAPLSTLTGHSSPVYSVAFSPDGSRMASGAYDETVRLWDANTGTHLSTLTGHSSLVRSVAFSPDGSRVVSGSYDKTVRLWNVNTGALLSTLTGHSSSIRSVAFSADGSRVASGSFDGTVRLWDANTAAQPFNPTGHSSSVRSVAFSPDGSRVASGSYDKTVHLWDANTGAHLSTLIGHSSLVRSVAFSADGSRVASGSDDETVRMWDANIGAHIFTLTSHSSPVYSVAFSADGSRVAAGSYDKTVRLWDSNTGKHLSTLTGHSSSLCSVAFSPDSSRIASGSDDETVRLWDASTGAHLFTLIGHSSSVRSVTFSVDGSRVASGSDDKTVRLWDANTGAHLSRIILPLAGSITSVFLLPNNSQVIDQVISPRFQPLRYSIIDSTSLLLLVERKNPPITGIMMANLMTEEGDNYRWEVVSVCWFPADIRVRCLSVDHSNPRMAIGSQDGRVMTLDFYSHRSSPHTYS